MRRIGWITLGVLLFAACGGEKTAAPDKTEAETGEVASTEAVAVPDSHYLARGKAIAQASFKTLKGYLTAAMKEGGVPGAIAVCAGKASVLLDSLSKAHGARVQRVSHKPRNPANAANPDEVALIEQYEAMRKAGEPLRPVVRKSNDEVVFYAPITIPGELCLRCHGVPGQDIAEEDYILIRQYYPQDRAVGFRMGDVRGLWKIVFPREKAAL